LKKLGLKDGSKRKALGVTGRNESNFGIQWGLLRGDSMYLTWGKGRSPRRGKNKR